MRKPSPRISRGSMRSSRRSNGEIAIVGDFDADAERSREESSATWKSPRPTPASRIRSSQPARRRRGRSAGQGQRGAVRGLSLSLNDRNREYRRATSRASSWATAPSRIPARPRQKDGLSYGDARTSGESDRRPTGRSGPTAIFAPENSRACARASRGVRRAAKDGFTDAEVQAAKAGVMQRRLLSAERKTAASRRRS